MLQRRRRLLGLGLRVLDVAVLAAVAAEHPDGLLADPWIALVDIIGQRGHRDRVPLDRMPDPESPGAIDGLRIMHGHARHTVRAVALSRSARGGPRPGWRSSAT